MKKFTAVLAIVLILVTLVSALPASAAGDLNVEPIDKYDDYGYYAYFDFENYDGSTSHLAYMRDAASKNADGKLCNPFGFLMNGQGNVYGTRAVKTESDGNKYLSFVQTQANDGAYGVIGVFSMQSDINSKNCIIADAAEISFRFRVHETQPETATGIMRVINLRRGSAAANVNFVGADKDGNLYARILGSMVQVYTNTDKSKFLDISFKWYDASNTYSLYVNGDPVVEAMSIGSVNSGGNTYRDGSFVKRTYNDDFSTVSRSLVGTTAGHTRAIELFRGDDKQYGFDIDDIKLKRVETAQRGAIYYENSFNSSNDGVKSRVDIIAGNDTYILQNSKNITFSDGAINMPAGSFFAVNTQVYSLLAEGNFVIEAKVKANPTHTTGYKPVFDFYDGINNSNLLSVDPSGNLYLENNKPETLIAGYKLDGQSWLDITVVAIKNLENAGKFGNFGVGKTTSSKNCSYYYSYYINGDYVGSSRDYTCQEWKITDEAAGTGVTLSNKKFTITHTEVVGTETAPLDISGLVKVADGSMTDANHVIYKTSDGNTYYDVEYDADAITQLRYSTMVLGDLAGNKCYVRFFGDGYFEGSVDDVRIYSGTCPEWYYANINSEKGGNIINADFSKLGLSGSPSKAQTTTASGVDVTGVFITYTLTNGKLVRKTANGTVVTPDNVLDTDYATLTLNNENWFDYYLPSPAVKNGVREAEYSFEVTLKNLNLTAGTGEDQEAYSGMLHMFRQRIEDEYVEGSVTKVKAYSSGDLFSVDTDNLLWGGDFSYSGTEDTRFPLCDAEGKQITIDNSKWNTLRADIHFIDDGNSSIATVSYYYNGESVYLEDGNVASGLDLRRTSDVFAAHLGSPNYRVRFTQMMGGDSITMDIKSIKISANNIEKPVYTETSEDKIEINDNVSVFELTVPKYTVANSVKYYDVLKLTKNASSATSSLGLVSVEENSGKLAVHTGGSYYSLYYADGSAIVLTDEPLNIVVVYDDIKGVARYYVDEKLAYINENNELTPAVDVSVSDIGFATLDGVVTTGYGIFGGYPADENKLEGYSLKAYNVKDSDAAEIIGYQESTVDNGVRIIAGVDSLYYSNVGFEVEIFEEGISKGKTDVSDNLVYSSIVANEETITAESKGYGYLATLVISDLPETIPENSYILVRSYASIAGSKHYDSTAKIAVSETGYEFVETSDKDIYNKKQAVLLVGQSNMAGRGDLNSVEAIYDSRITMMRASGDSYVWVPMVEPIHTDKTIAGVGIAASFAKAFVENFDCDLGLIPAAVGGTSLAQWTKGYSGSSDFDLYENAIAKAKAAQKDSEICAILWHQGCSNTGTTNYDERLKVILDDFIADLGLDPEKIVIVTGELARAKGSTADNVNNGLQRLVDDYANYGVASSEGLITQDENTHFDGPSLRVFGYRYFAHFYKMITGKTFEFDDDIEKYRVTPEVDDDEEIVADTTCVANVDFNNLPAGTKDAPTTYSSRTTIGNIDIRPGGATANIQVFPYNYDDNTDKYIAVNSVSGSTPPFVDITTDYPKGSAIVTEFKIRLGDNFAINGPLVKFVQNNPIASTHLIRITSDGKLADAVNGTTTSSVLKTPEGTDVMVDKFEWTAVKIVSDLANNTKDIYIDGVLCLKGAKIKANASDASNFKVDLTRLVQLAENMTGTVYIDDFKSYYDVITSVSFDSFDTGKITTSATIGDVKFSISSTSPAEIIEDAVNSGNKYASITCGVANSQPYIDITNSSAAGIDVTIEAKFKYGKYGENDFAACGDLLKLLDPSDKSIALVRLAADGTLENYVYGTGLYPSSSVSLGVKLSDTEWTTVKVVCHMADNTKDIYVNGTLVLEGASLYNADGAASYVLAKTRIMQFKSSGIGTVYLDDFQCYN